MKKFAVALIVSGIALVGAAVPALATPQEKVTICHRTNSDKNPYVLITVSANAVDGEGNNDHTHHVVDEQHPRADIIPAPFTTADLNGDGDETDNGETLFFCPGPVGPQGPTGPAGPQGPAGEDGADGVDGNDGENGVDGSDGVDGEDGNAGPAGSAGVNGAVGSAGPAGANGTDGAAGPAGGTPAVAPVTAPITSLPRTGTNSWLLLLGAGLLLSGITSIGMGKLIKARV